ncbi:MAG TPA: universal stress protein [Candidatus Acidoferrum sp.]|nr:universal stress protein [Candidatus Acidoferrum sp.]
MQHSFSRILLPIDTSFQSEVATETALTISKLFSSKITVMHVVPNQIPTLPNRIYVSRDSFAPISTATGQFPRTLIVPEPKEYLIPDEVVNEATASYVENGEDLLSETAALFAKEGINAEQKLEKQNDIADTIIEETISGNYDCVIIGNSGNEEDESDLHLGSVAARVSTSNLTNIMVTRKKPDLKSILLAVDGTEKDERAIENTYVLAKATKSKVVLLTVQEKSLSRFGPKIGDFGLQILKRATNMLPEIEVDQKLMFGDPASLIIDIAKQAEVDLIILSRGGHGRFRSLLGSVSDHVLRHATVTVLIVK